MGKDLRSRFGRVKQSKKDAGKPVTPGCYELAGVKIVCSHCGKDEFNESEAQLNPTMTSALLGVDYKKVYTLICTECGFLQWMIQPPHRQLDEWLR